MHKKSFKDFLLNRISHASITTLIVSTIAAISTAYAMQPENDAANQHFRAQQRLPVMEGIDTLRAEAESFHRMYVRYSGQIVGAYTDNEHTTTANLIYHPTINEVHWVSAVMSRSSVDCQECKRARDASERARALDEEIIRYCQAERASQAAERAAQLQAPNRSERR